MSGLNGVQGLEGWQWLFLLEGLPSVLMGIVVFFYLTDRPKDARWLSSEEREAIARSVEQEKRLTPHSHNGLLAAFKDFRVYLFAFAVFSIRGALVSSRARCSARSPAPAPEQPRSRVELTRPEARQGAPRVRPSSSSLRRQRGWRIG